MLTSYSPQAPSSILQDLLNLGVLRIDSTNRVVLKPSGQPMGVAKTVVTNNAAASYAIPEGSAYVAFIGTQVGTLTINLPAAAAAYDGQPVTIYTQAAVGTALTLTSTGGTIVGAPATLTAGQVLRYVFHAATNQWLPT